MKKIVLFCIIGLVAGAISTADAMPVNEVKDSPTQQKLLRRIDKLAETRGRSIPASAGGCDVFKRRLNLRHDGLFSHSGTRLGKSVTNSFSKIAIPGSLEFRETQGSFLWYDVRWNHLRKHPALAVPLTLAYVKRLQEKTGRKDGHLIDLAYDAYGFHHDIAGVIAETFIRTGATQNGGGVIAWGMQNGGAIRSYAQTLHALTGEGGHWMYGTKSHNKDKAQAGVKMGTSGEVFCGPEVQYSTKYNPKNSLFNRVVTRQFADLLPTDRIGRLEDHVVYVGDMTKFRAKILADMIRARTGASGPEHMLLDGYKGAIDAMNNPLCLDYARIMEALGADIQVTNRELKPNFDEDRAIDPNEPHELEDIIRASQRSGRTHIVLDPDADRGGAIAKRYLTGNEHGLLFAENLARRNPEGYNNAAVYDMRTAVSAALFERASNEHGNRISFTPFEPGYPNAMAELGRSDRVQGSEMTGHHFFNVNQKIFGATTEITHLQGGDDGPLAMALLAGLSVHDWEGRTPPQQLEWIRKEYQIPRTVSREYKPVLTDLADSEKKVLIAETMTEMALAKLGKRRGFDVVPLESGVLVLRLDAKGSPLIGVLNRYSNTGPTFTVSVEALNNLANGGMTKLERTELVRMAALMNDARLDVVSTHGEFGFRWGKNEPNDLSLAIDHRIGTLDKNGDVK